MLKTVMRSKVTFTVLFKFSTNNMYDFYNWGGKAGNVLLRISARIKSLKGS